MLGIHQVDHVGIRISDRDRSVAFYEKLGYALVSDTGFNEGHPIIMEHSSHLVLNLLGPASKGAGHNVLMDEDDKLPGITHVAYRVKSVEETEALFAELGIEITGRFSYGGIKHIFFRDPDRNVIELVENDQPTCYADADSDSHC